MIFKFFQLAGRLTSKLRELPVQNNEQRLNKNASCHNNNHDKQLEHDYG